MRLTEAGVVNCDFITGDAYDIARLWPEPVDLVFMANAFHDVPDPPRLAGGSQIRTQTGRTFCDSHNWHARPREETTINPW